MNKNDLRVRKTRRAIRKAFLELAQEKPMEKITVKELSERAEINKATFYSHYETIYALIDELEQEAVDIVIDQMKNARGLKEDPRAFVNDLAGALSSSSLYLYIGTSSYEKNFHDRLLRELRQIRDDENLSGKEYERIGTALSFIIQGLLGSTHFVPDLTRRNLDVIADLVAEGVSAV